MSHSATLVLRGHQAEVVASALQPEAAAAPPRSQVRLERQPQELQVHITATDTAALRAVLNSYLRWMGIAWEVGARWGG